MYMKVLNVLKAVEDVNKHDANITKDVSNYIDEHLQLHPEKIEIINEGKEQLKRDKLTKEQLDAFDELNAFNEYVERLG